MAEKKAEGREDALPVRPTPGGMASLSSVVRRRLLYPTLPLWTCTKSLARQN